MPSVFLIYKYVYNAKISIFLCQIPFEPRYEKTCLQGFRPGPTQTGLEVTEDG